MTQDFTSVTLFFSALRAALLNDAGMTVERALGTYDSILTSPYGFARLRMVVVSPTVSAICLTPGIDADALAASVDDPELCLPFNTSAPERFRGSIQWWPELGRVQIFIIPRPLNPDSASGNALRCYRAEYDIVHNMILVSHENPPIVEAQISFKVSGVPYIESGV